MNRELYLVICLVFINGFSSLCQTKKKDSVKTEVIRVDTKYNPKISDANKIKGKPEINLKDKNEKKSLTYTITSIPVASTFTPKSGVVKAYNPGVKERLYNNFLAAGFGNYMSPYFEAFLKHKIKYYGEFGLSTNYQASQDNIENTLLDSDFSDFRANLYFNREERFFEWKADLDTEFKSYNWYGINSGALPQNIIDNIAESQNYSFVKASGKIDLQNSFFSSSKLSISNFSDAFESNEILVNFDADFAFMLGLFKRDMKDLTLNVGLEYLNGSFTKEYITGNEVNYSIFTTHIHPIFEDTFGDLSVRVGTKVFASMDMENEINNFLIYPDIKIETAIIKENLNVFVGADGGLTTNTFRSFVDLNPFVAPSLAITQTSQAYNAFAGFKGLINNSFSFNVSAHLIQEDDKPLFIRNNSKFNGSNQNTLLGYEFGNSFQVVYDDVKTFRFIADMNYDINQNLTLGVNTQFDNFTVTNQSEAWNLPSIQACFFGRYSAKKWYASTQFFYVGDRNEVTYSSIHPSSPTDIDIVDGFIDLNLNGGYHFNDRFSVFIRMNNILNSDYQIFSNFNVQGLQILAGITHKFDFN